MRIIVSFNAHVAITIVFEVEQRATGIITEKDYLIAFRPYDQAN